MAVAYKSKGGWSIGPSGTFVAVPTGGGAPAANDILLVVTESCNTASTAGTPVIDPTQGWTTIVISTQGDGSAGVTTLAVWAKRAVGGDTGVWVTGTPNHVSGEMFVYSGAMITGTPWVGGAANGANSGNGTMTGLNTIKDNSLVVMACTSTRDANSTAQFSSWANANLTSINERDDNTSLTGAGGGFGVAEGYLATAGASGNSTVTIATSEQWRSVHVALAPDTTPAGTTYDDDITLSQVETVSDANNLVMSMALTLAEVEALTDGNFNAMSMTVTLVRVETIAPAVQAILEAILSIVEVEGLTASANAIMNATLTVGEIQSISMIATGIAIVSKGYVTVLDFSASPVQTTSFRANSVYTEDL